MTPGDTKIKLNGGALMPVLGFGTWLALDEDAYQSVKCALQTGYRHIDTAYMYGNEESVGRAINDCIQEGLVARADIFVTTKLWGTQHRPEIVKASLLASLKRLQLDYVDLYHMHYPMSLQEGEAPHPTDENGQLCFTDIDYLDTWKAMQDLVDSGLTRHIGVCNFNHEQIQRLLDAKLRHKPACLQIEISPYCPNDDLIKFATSNGIAVTAYCVLGNPGRPDFARRPGDRTLLAEDSVIALATKYAKTPAQILLRWGIDRGYSVLCKSVRPERIKENSSVFDFSLTAADVASLRGFPFRRFLEIRLLVPHHKYYPFVFDPE